MNKKGGVVDKIESGQAIIVIGRKQIIVSLKKFPEDIREGDFVNLETFIIDKEETEKRLKKARGLIREIYSKDYHV